MPETATSESIVTLTDSAVEKMKALVAAEASAGKESAGIRIGVVGGGCAGLQYQMDPCDAANPEDIVQEINGIPFYLHPMVIPYIKGIQIDFSDAMVDGGFKFINPNAQSTCGCGTSFGV